MSELTLVYAATGEQGRPVAQELLRRGERVRVMVRHPERAGVLQDAEVLTGDVMNPDDVARAFGGVTRLSLTLPLAVDPIGTARTALEAASRAGVRRVVLNTSGQTPGTPTGSPMLDYRLALEETMRASGLNHVILRPTAYLQNLLGPWTLPRIAGEGVLAYPVPDDHRISWFAAEDLGPITAAALEKTDVDGVLNVGGAEAVTGPELAAALGEATGRPVRYEAQTPEAFGAMMGQIMGPEMGAAATEAYRSTWRGAPDAMAVDVGALERALGVQTTHPREWFMRHREGFLSPAMGPA